MNDVLLETHLPGIRRIHQGKVRDIYEIEGKLLLVATDRLSAFDVIMSRGIPGKGEMLTQLTLFWLRFFESDIENHLITADVERMPAVLHPFRRQLQGRSMLCRKASIFPIECVARGYIAGSGWKEYRQTGAVCGQLLPAGLRQAEKLPQAIFTPATKAPKGQHDENIDFERAAAIVGRDHAARLRDLTLRLYAKANAYANSRGIIIADTKFEFGLYEGRVILCDEVLTPDSSRFWDSARYRPGTSPESYDKQIVRDWLEQQPWNKTPPPPELPDDIVNRTAARYREVIELLRKP
ncbi:phosphoribosylaminoimidazolesuccinocarboxamide synthase [bacterium]|nr:MAG: phosphoribosylaminoimidazolesuccinocarboxamide synthase [bacterium]RIK64651.1 MAG: phosphoribosylaminoimidazolesuccinocarboxamide synthase [Planctomycetota bacterium]